MASQTDVKRVVDQLKSDIDHIAAESKNLKNGKRFSNLRKMHDLKLIVSTLEDIDYTVETLLHKNDSLPPSE